MSPNEWQEIIAWVDDRFPRGWTPDQAVAFFDDLKGYEASDIWDALYRIYDRGIEFPPNGSQLKKEATEVLRQRAIRESQERQGIGSGEGGTWAEWARSHGRPKSFAAAIKQRHAELFPNGCRYPSCDVHV